MQIRFIAPLVIIHGIAAGSLAADRVVNTLAEFRAALTAAQPGDRVLLSPNYNGVGSIYANNLNQVTITSQLAGSPAVLNAGGGLEALHLTSPRNVTLSHLIVENWTGNGINIDDGGNWPDGAAENIYVHDVVIRNAVAPRGNHDALKMSGVNDFVIERCQITNWSTGGSAIDSVGTHFGLIENCHLINMSVSPSSPGTAIQNKGGTKSVVIRANYVRLNAGRAIGAGGNTGPSYFRFVPGDSGYEGDDISAAGNIIIGGDSAANYININGGLFAHNYLEDQTRWVLRILNESAGLVQTQNGVFRDNIVVFGGPSFSRVSNVGANTIASSFAFAGNQWFNEAAGGPTNQAALQLSAMESAGIYGVNPEIDASGPVTFPMPWGQWVVNPHLTAAAVEVPEYATLQLASRDATLGSFDPLAANPLGGSWTLTPLTGSTVMVPAQSYVVLVTTAAPPTLTAVRSRKAHEP